MAPRIKKRSAPITARDGTYLVTRASPTVAGAQETLDYVPSPFEKSYGRRRLSSEQDEARQKYERAWQRLQGPGAIPWESSIQVTRGPRGSPSEALMEAGRTLAEASGELGKHVVIVEMIVGFGFTDLEAATEWYRRPANRHEAEHIGRTFKDCLTLLAKKWFPDRSKRSGNRLFYRGFNGLTADLEFIEGGHTAHASVGKVDIRRRS